MRHLRNLLDTISFLALLATILLLVFVLGVLAGAALIWLWGR